MFDHCLGAAPVPFARCCWLVLGLLLLSMPLAAQVAEPGKGRCQIDRVLGPEAVLRRAGADQPAVTGQTLGRDDILLTGPEAQLALSCVPGVHVTVGPDTVLQFARLTNAGTGRTWGLQLSQGTAGFVLEPQVPAGFQALTPSAVAAADGASAWAMEVSGGATKTLVYRGAVMVAAADGYVVLSAGNGVDVSAVGRIGGVEQWPAGRAAGFSARLGPDWP